MREKDAKKKLMCTHKHIDYIVYVWRDAVKVISYFIKMVFRFHCEFVHPIVASTLEQQF